MSQIPELAKISELVAQANCRLEAFGMSMDSDNLIEQFSMRVALLKSEAYFSVGLTKQKGKLPISDGNPLMMFRQYLPSGREENYTLVEIYLTLDKSQNRLKFQFPLVGKDQNIEGVIKHLSEIIVNLEKVGSTFLGIENVFNYLSPYLTFTPKEK